MIQNHNIEPTFVPRGQAGLEKGIASQQISKAARAEVEAISAKDNADFRLAKATTDLKLAEVAYFAAIEKSAWNMPELKSAYNNALAGFRDADKTAEIATKELRKAEGFIAGLRTIAKAGITNGEELKAAVKAAKSPEDRKACVDAAEKLKLMFFLPKGWKAEAEKTVAKAKPSTEDDSSVEYDDEDATEDDSSMDDSSMEKSVGDLSDDELKAMDAEAEHHERMSGVARQMGDMSAHAEHASKAGEIRGKMAVYRANKDNMRKSANYFLTKNKRAEVEAIEKASMFILCPNCMGKDSLSCPACDDDGMMHPKGLNSLMLSPTDKCPMCGGDNPSTCECMMKSTNPFSINSLLTRDFQKSAAYQEYLIAKGDVGGHEFHGNQYSEGGGASGSKTDSYNPAGGSAVPHLMGKIGDAGVSSARTVPVKDKDAPQPVDPNWNPRTSGPLINMPLRGIQIGFNDLMKEYEGNIQVHADLATGLESEAKKAAGDGDVETAANKMDEASKEWEKSAGAARSIFAMHEKYEKQGVKGADSSSPKVAAFREQARAIRENQKQAALDKAAALAELANGQLDAGSKATGILSSKSDETK
jgi:hypothetical protein